MRTARPLSERGAAALEFALVGTVVLVLVALAGPLGGALLEQLRLGRTAGRTVRFATTVLPDGQQLCDGSTTGYRPSAAEVATEAACAHYAAASAGPSFGVSVDPEPRAARSGEVVTVEITNRVDLGPLGAWLGRPTLQLTATASATEE